MIPVWNYLCLTLPSQDLQKYSFPGASLVDTPRSTKTKWPHPDDDDDDDAADADDCDDGVDAAT